MERKSKSRHKAQDAREQCRSFGRMELELEIRLSILTLADAEKMFDFSVWKNFLIISFVSHLHHHLFLYTDCEKASSDQFYTNVASSTTSNDFVTDDDPLKRNSGALNKPNSTSIKYNPSNQVSTHEKFNPGGEYTRSLIFFLIFKVQ